MKIKKNGEKRKTCRYLEEKCVLKKPLRVFKRGTLLKKKCVLFSVQ